MLSVKEPLTPAERERGERLAAVIVAEQDAIMREWADSPAARKQSALIQAWRAERGLADSNGHMPGAQSEPLATESDDAPPKPVAAHPPAERLVIRALSTVTATETDWLWRRWLARGKFHLLGGHAGDGKGTIMAALAAIGSVGGAWPDGTTAPQFRTLFVLGEEALDDTLRPRLDMHGADPEQVFAIETVLDGEGRERFFNVKTHLELLEAALAEHRIDLLVIDPLTTVMGGSDRNAEGDTRDALTPLIKLAERLNVAVIGIAHVGKPNGTNRTPAQRILGATAFHALARVVWMTAPDDCKEMALGVVKSNLAMKPDALAWSREEDEPIVWTGTAARSIADLLSGARLELPRDQAEGFLRELLKGGSVASHDVETAAKEEGIKWATVRRAADAIGVLKWKGTGADGRWYWRLRDGEPQFPDLDPGPNLLTDDEGEQVTKNQLAHPYRYTSEQVEQHDASTPVSAQLAQLAHPPVLESEQVVSEPTEPNLLTRDEGEQVPPDCAHPAICAVRGPGPHCSAAACSPALSRATSGRKSR